MSAGPIATTAAEDERALGATARALAPAGLLLIETFTLAQANRPRGPSDPRMLLAPGELERAFPTLEILEAREQDVEGPAVAGILARRPR